MSLEEEEERREREEEERRESSSPEVLTINTEETKQEIKVKEKEEKVLPK